MQNNPMDWDATLPAWWVLDRFPDDTYTLTRVDGIQISSFKTQMGFSGWCINKGEEHFTELYGGGDGGAVLLVVDEAVFEYPDPTSFLADLDRHYQVPA